VQVVDSGGSDQAPGAERIVVQLSATGTPLEVS